MSHNNLPMLKTALPEFLSSDAYGFVHVTGHRIGIQTLVRCYNDGYSPEMLASEYPTLSLATIHKVIAFYLEHCEEVDAYVAECDAAIEAQRAVTPRGPTSDELRQRLANRQLAEQA